MTYPINTKCLVANSDVKNGMLSDNIALVISAIGKNEFLYLGSKSVIMEPARDGESNAITGIS